MEPKTTPHPTHFVEILGPDRQIWRFALGTKAGFAVDRINNKLRQSSYERVMYIEAVKEGEIPVEFGSDAELVTYGSDWILQTVQAGTTLNSSDGFHSHWQAKSTFDDQQAGGTSGGNLDMHHLCQGGKVPKGARADFTIGYSGKIALCIFFMFLFSGALKLFLECMPNTWSSLASSGPNDIHDL